MLNGLPAIWTATDSFITLKRTCALVATEKNMTTAIESSAVFAGIEAGMERRT
jgi:hypothetical protein